MSGVLQTMLLRITLNNAQRGLCTSTTRLGGQKAKRRKKDMRVNNPQLVGKPAVEPTPTTIALAHFDEFYRQVYQDQWSSMRLGLLTRQKYCAVVNNFGETEETCRLLTELGCVSVTQEVTDRQKLVVGHSKAVQEINTDNQVNYQSTNVIVAAGPAI